MKKARLLRFFVLGTLFFCLSVQLSAQWSTDSTVNNAICTATDRQENPEIVSDGSGGAIITWEDRRFGTVDIYAQRINASGAVQWSTDGVAICTGTNEPLHPEIVSDGSGGAIITWKDYRSGRDFDIYAQRINASGKVQWSTDGLAICTETGDQYYPEIISDGSGGAIITWYGYNGLDYYIYAQRINISGEFQWSANGVRFCKANGLESSPKIVSDGIGGAIITWHDIVYNNHNSIYAQRINASGEIQWHTDGVAICPTGNSPTIVNDGSGGAIITWEDQRNSGTMFDIYAQHINAAGEVQWSANGIAISTAIYEQRYPKIVSDGVGGAIIMWFDVRSGISNYIYALHINVAGEVQWSANGVAICKAIRDQRYPKIVSDGAGGAIITFYDSRIGTNYDDIYAQHINSTGEIQWSANGVAISKASIDQKFPTIVSDGSGGAIITWQDNRNGFVNYDIYASQINANGSLGAGPLSVEETVGGELKEFALTQNYPNPFNPSTTISYQLPENAFVQLKIFDILGREIKELVNEYKTSGIYKVNFDGSKLTSGVYFYHLQAGNFTDTKKLIFIK